MQFPENLKYTDSHEWVRLENGSAVVGITEYAQDELGDIVFVDIPETRAFSIGESFGSIEAVKTVTDLVAPLTGTLNEINPELTDSPELINTDPYGKGWMIKMSVDSMDEYNSLLTAAEYKALIGK